MFSRKLIVELFDKYCELNDNQKMLEFLDNRFKKTDVSNYQEIGVHIYKYASLQLCVEEKPNNDFSLNIAEKNQSAGIPWFYTMDKTIKAGLKSATFDAIYYNANPENDYDYCDNILDVTIYWNNVEDMKVAMKTILFDELISINSVD